jgi:ribosomal-protein-alanine N-acetyltransferase
MTTTTTKGKLNELNFIRLNNLCCHKFIGLQTALRRVGEYLIRRCENEDLNAVVEINMDTLPEHYSDYFFESTLRELPESFVVAELDKKVVGYIMCKIEYGFSNFRKLGFVKKGHVVSVAVLQNHRGKGLGNALMLEGINGIMNRKGDEIYLEVRVSNKPAILIYQKLGFQIKSKLRSYYRDGEDAFLMALEFN